MGWIISDYRWHRQVEHMGNTAGFTARVRQLPDAEIGIFVLTNWALANPLITGVGNYALEMLPGLEHGGARVISIWRRLRV